MSKRRVILARHGQTELNRLGIIQGSGINPGLNEVGLAQAQDLFRRWKGIPDLVISSGMVRANQTAEPFKSSAKTYKEDSRFREICWGDFEGKVAKSWMRQSYAELLHEWEQGNTSARLKNAESADELADRLGKGWEDLLQMDFSTALICMHGRALRCLVCMIDEQPIASMNGYAHSNAGFYVAEEHDNSWKLIERNVTDHLTTNSLTEKR